jgi:hypothetical protein
MIEELKDDNTLTVARKYQILKIIHEKVDEVWKDIIYNAGGNLNWYSFSNDNGSNGGEFDVNKYDKWIDLIGEWSGNLYRYYDGFPTNFLYIDYKKELIEALEEDKNADLILKEKIKNSYKKAKAKKDILKQLSNLSLEKLQKILQDNI